MTKKTQKKMKKHGKERVKAIPSTDDAARDEGPRLIPLRTEPAEEVPMSHYLHLADKALGTAAKPAKVKQDQSAERKPEDGKAKKAE